jgi:hypothetical protein
VTYFARYLAHSLAVLVCLVQIPLVCSVAAQPAPAADNNYDGPAELPRVYMKTSLADTPTSGTTHSVSPADNLQNALDSAQCGDTLRLKAGSIFTGVFTLPAKNCDDAHWIIVRTSAADSALPPEGTRLTPCYAGVGDLPGRPPFHCTSTEDVLVKINFNGRGGPAAIVLAPGANHYRLIGLEVTRTASTGVVYNLIGARGPADHLVFDRMWIHGTAQDETVRGLMLSHVRYTAAVDSYFSDFHCVAKSGACVDSQAIAGGLGDDPTGPFKIVNNFLEAAGESVMFGGGQATTTPADIEIRRNHMFKPITWMRGQPGYVGGVDGNPFIVKNLFELKNAQRVLLEGNILENTWGGFSQSGFGVLITAKNQAGAHGTNLCPDCQITDVTIRYCRIKHVASGMQIGNGLSDNGGAAKDGQRYSIHDIIIDDIEGKDLGGSGNLFQLSAGPGAPKLQNIRVGHITAFASGGLFNIGNHVTNPKMSNFIFTNNIVMAGEHNVSPTGGGRTNCAFRESFGTPSTRLQNCFDPFTFSHNAIIGGDSSWPKDNFLPKQPSDIHFVNYNNGSNGDYHLSPSSKFRRAGSDGRDLGADVDAVQAALAAVE